MLKKKYRIKKKKEFSYIYKKGNRHKGNYVIIYKIFSNEKKIGFSVSKQVGNAVIRNLYRRRFQFIIEKYFSTIKNGKYVVIAIINTKNATFKQLETDFISLLKEINK